MGVEDVINTIPNCGAQIVDFHCLMRTCVRYSSTFSAVAERSSQPRSALVLRKRRSLRKNIRHKNISHRNNKMPRELIPRKKREALSNSLFKKN
jgi:hypothetical protein